MKRFTRKSNAFSKKGREPRPHGGLYAIHYNFYRIHGSLRVTPTIEAGLADTAYDMS